MPNEMRVGEKQRNLKPITARFTASRLSATSLPHFHTHELTQHKTFPAASEIKKKMLKKNPQIPHTKKKNSK